MKSTLTECHENDKNAIRDMYAKIECYGIETYDEINITCNICMGTIDK